MNDILVVSDMADLKRVRYYHPEWLGVEFLFSSRDGRKLNGWTAENIYVTPRAIILMSEQVQTAIKYQVAKGAKVCHVS
jgi:hypothetical protein